MWRSKPPRLKTNLCSSIFLPLPLEVLVLGWRPRHTAIRKPPTSLIKPSFRSRPISKSTLRGSNVSTQSGLPPSWWWIPPARSAIALKVICRSAGFARVWKWGWREFGSCAKSGPMRKSSMPPWLRTMATSQLRLKQFTGGLCASTKRPTITPSWVRLRKSSAKNFRVTSGR